MPRRAFYSSGRLLKPESASRPWVAHNRQRARDEQHAAAVASWTAALEKTEREIERGRAASVKSSE